MPICPKHGVFADGYDTAPLCPFCHYEQMNNGPGCGIPPAIPCPSCAELHAKLDALRAEVEALNVVLEQAREHEAWHNNEQRDMKVEVERLREEVEVLRPPAQKYNEYRARAEKAEAALAEIAEGRK